MSSSLRRGTLAATALAACTLTLAACGAGTDAATQLIEPDTARVQVGPIKIQAVNIITTDGGKGPVGVSARIFNNSDKPQTLEAVRIKGVDGRFRLSPPPGEDTMTVPAGGVLALGGKGHAAALAPEPGSITPGNLQPVTFVLSRTGKVELRADVVPAGQGNNAQYGPSAAPTPSGAPTGDPSPRPSGPSSEPTGSVTGSPTAGAETQEPAAGESPAGE
ncbi:hypothetical protein N566_02335 [Streptomycetaceae bacterium MP113-05]|nr:hypothetical protein N566_02335 [Streptomycetaceae bacterium MP113-05]